MADHSPRNALAVALTVALLCAGRPARAQGLGSDASDFPKVGGGGSLLGNSPGAGGGALSGASGNSPQSGQILGTRPGVSTPKGIPTSISSPATLGPTILQRPISAPDLQPISPSSAPLYGTLEIPGRGADDDGPPDGVTLEQAIGVTLQRSLDLRSKFYEIPQARADVLQAGLRANPVFYADAQLVPYGQFNRSVPGGPTQYDINVTHPVDVSRKRRARVEVATRAERVLEAQYQEALRQRIDDVYDAFVLGTLASRQTVRYARQSTQGLARLATKTEELYRGGSVSLGDFNRVKIQLRTARLGLVDAEAAYRKAKLELGSLMNLSPEEIAALEIKGSIEDTSPPPPPAEELKRIALEARPDVVSYRLGVRRAEADVALARANRLSDIFVLYQPYTYQNNTPFGLKSATSWALGVTAPLPVYNRNQGAIRRAELNVDQTRIELSDLERQVGIDVEKAVAEYEVTRREVQELRAEVIPEATQIRDEMFRLYTSGEKSAGDFIGAQLEFNQVAKQYLDTAIRHRRSMLNLNTVTGSRIMP
ncbi:Cobalt-zinc-cadmium resistance protein CzcC precursor [Aquisphaera giovannonii]|uniref:Cobalt-zinc-cadmium resistance protein CzcC n=1 Tax=Aquisphaera giovannonii TaxID=406548 RepID=A0A5B9W2Y7_9BACT|nr:TolC family protein [Aquisphaera giovannonii]QEH34609.1 Cobalt-zinc-cadmium resistance protein CzcC precursor [Aquisphaera giovannonii]